MKGETAIRVTIAFAAVLTGIAIGRWSNSSVDKKMVKSPHVPLPNQSYSSSHSAATPSMLVAKADTKHVPGWTKSGTILDILKGRDRFNRAKDLTDYINGLQSTDLANAFLATRQLSPGADRDLARELLAARWAQLDPDGALAFAASNHQFDSLTSDIFQELATGDLQSALARAQAMTDPTQRYEALRGALSVMAETDPQGALQLAASAGDFAHNEPLSQIIYRQWSSMDPTAAAAYAAQDTSTQGWRAPITQVMRTWGSDDPQAALNYSLTLADQASQKRSVGEIVRRWGDEDPTAAAQWINSAPPGPVRDAAAAALASSVAAIDPRAAVGWAQSIVDETARANALQRVSRQVMWRDPTNGAATLQAAGVPPEVLQRVTASPGG